MIKYSLKYSLFFAGLSLILGACKSSKPDFDASGSFEAIERMISAEATGKILSLNIDEGQTLKAGDTIGKIDVANLEIQAQQMEASIDAIGKKTNNATPQVAVLQSQYNTQKDNIATLKQQILVVEKEILRFQKLVIANAAPTKQLDDLSGQKSVLEKQLATAQNQLAVIDAQIAAAKESVAIQNRAVLSEVSPNEKRLDLIEKQISDGIIVNEFAGTVTNQLAYNGEFTSIGRPLYKIADLSEIILRVYISGNQLAQVKLNDEVRVFTDDGNGGMKETTGIITWISNKGEFTPKTIRTKDERTNMVYAIKVKVKNDGSYKIGMYGEIKFNPNA
ncbi:MAG: HlyD family efflux transporter periplasmic adaptor subunit [Chitinophagales bacterium]|nr:HlyD family efflux transporter periplasmic adaptor subunit [Bacteroidota bacterium]MCB9044093.1 HlyD family efflux transporter periplasmic adaptor subunit [Chitinophagales bacterium]